jgi:hypothetical protein
VKRAFVDLNTFSSRNMTKDGNIDYQFWFDKTIEEKLAAAIVMIEVSFNIKNFTKQKVDRTLISSHNLKFHYPIKLLQPNHLIDDKIKEPRIFRGSFIYLVKRLTPIFISLIPQSFIKFEQSIFLPL